MKLNPYESPRVGDRFEEQAMGDSDSVRQLLTEIRNAQCELLQLQRDALLLQKRNNRFFYARMAIPFVFIGVMLYFSILRTRFMPPFPLRTPPSAAPRAIPNGTSFKPSSQHFLTGSRVLVSALKTGPSP